MAIALAASYGDLWNTSTTPKTASVTVANGDCLIVVGLGRSAGHTITTPTGGALTYALQNQANAAGSPTLFMWSTFPLSGQTFTLSVGDASGFTWGMIALRYTGVASIGAKTARNDGAVGVDTLSITTTTDHSAIVLAVNDSSGNGAATYATTDAGSFTQVSTNSAQANYVGHYLDSGTHGAKTVGITTPSGATNAVGAIELVPTVVAAAPKQLIVMSRAALINASTV
jgi:hypothetical protein